MGCQVVSVYDDEMIGILGYSDDIMQDLINRDYGKPFIWKQYQQNDLIQCLYGFTQSYVQGNLFTFHLSEQEYFIYNAGRFLVRMNTKDYKQKHVMHNDLIIDMSMMGNLCACACKDGLIVVWNVQFMQPKIKISQNSIPWSSISLNGKCIFATDITTPNNIIYCYDLYTAKIKAKAHKPSMEPTLKGISPYPNKHVTIGADGLWFISLNKNDLTIIKGIFGSFPKTSMSCVDYTNHNQYNYIISGGVDGYLYLWLQQQCRRVIRLCDGQIKSLKCMNDLLLISNFNEVRSFSFKFVQKKNTKVTLFDQDIQQQQDIVYSLVDSYHTNSPLQTIALSRQKGIYYYCTRHGSMYTNKLPSSQSKQIGRIHLIMSIPSQGLSYLHQQQIWNIYPVSRDIFNFDALVWQSKQTFFKVQEQYIFETLNRNVKKPFTFDPNALNLAYFNSSGLIVCHRKLVSSYINNAQIQGYLVHQQLALQGPWQEDIICMNFTQNGYLFVTTQNHVLAYKNKEFVDYELLFKTKYYENCIPLSIFIKTTEVQFEFDNKKWIMKNESQKQQLTTNQIEEYNKDMYKKIHCSQLRVSSYEQNITVGDCFIIKWKHNL